MALEPVWKTHAWVLASDCGAPFEFNASRMPLSRLLRYTSVVTNQARAVRKRKLIDECINRTLRGAYWSITTDPDRSDQVAYPAALVNECVSRIRTDMDSFSDGEQRILENHGYLAADLRLQQYAGELFEPDPPELRPPHPNWMAEDRVREALRGSDRPRVFGRRR
jgi:NTE family protein